VTALGIAFAAGQALAVLLLVTPQLLIRQHPHGRNTAPMTDPRPNPTTWTAPDAIPSRHELQPAPLPADLEALVRSGHLTEVEPGRYRRAPRHPIAPPATQTPRQQHDAHVDRLAAAVLAGDGLAALATQVAPPAHPDTSRDHDDLDQDRRDLAAADTPPAGRAAPAPGSEPLRPSRRQAYTSSTAALVIGAHKRRRDRPEHDPWGDYPKTPYPEMTAGQTCPPAGYSALGDRSRPPVASGRSGLICTCNRSLREDDRMDDHVETGDAAAAVRRVLAAVDEGELEATPAERAYLAGALDVLEQIPARTPLH